MLICWTDSNRGFSSSIKSLIADKVWSLDLPGDSPAPSAAPGYFEAAGASSFTLRLWSFISSHYASTGMFLNLVYLVANLKLKVIRIS